MRIPPGLLFLVSGSAFLVAGAGASTAASPSAEAIVEYRGESIVAYRTWLLDGHLVVEVEHQKPWHTYAMDNIERARRRSGKDKPDTELPTVIEIEGGAQANGPWLQTSPQELSQPELRWYTWGFEGTSYFAVPVTTGTIGAVEVTINGQACTAERCAMIDDLKLVLSSGSRSADAPEIEIEGLAALLSDRH